MGDTKRTAEKFRPVIVTGLSGGGKSLAARYMEDLGYFCVDNLPPVFIPKFIDLCRETHGQISRAAIVVDTRQGVPPSSSARTGRTHLGGRDARARTARAHPCTCDPAD